MFSFAKNIVKTLEQSAETIINTSSSLINNDSDPYFQSAGSQYGFRVLYVESDSIAQKLGLEPWFDYIVGINYHELLCNNEHVPDFDLFVKELANCIGHPISLSVWNAKGGVVRQISIEKLDSLDPASTNSGSYATGNEGIVCPRLFQHLGFSFQATPLITATYVYHVLDVQANSPAESCGLLPHSDYIVGVKDGLFATGGEDLFGRVINFIYNKDPANCEIELYVYNHDFDVLRPVTIRPINSWGGNGILGCGVGYGYLHRLPQVVGKFDSAAGGIGISTTTLSDGGYLQAPGQTLYEIHSNTSKEFVPAAVSASAGATEGEKSTYEATESKPVVPVKDEDMVGIEQLSQQQLTSTRKKKKHTKVQVPDLSDYFEQETNRSSKIDGDVKSNVESLPPPPKSSK